jgi:glutamine synthetase
MSNLDERPTGHGGSRPSAKPMLTAERNGFVERHDLWTERQHADAAQMRRVIDELGIEMVRVCFADQYGVLRGKTITRAALPTVLRSGLTAPSSLLLKDASGRSTSPVFESLSLGGYSGYTGVGDIVLVPDPTSFRVLPWSRRTGIVLADLSYPDGTAVPFCSRGALRRGLADLAGRGLSWARSWSSTSSRAPTTRWRPSGSVGRDTLAARRRSGPSPRDPS